MPIIRQVQSNFSHGELDPKLFARPDVDVYFKGAQKLRNVLSIPQGGAKRRFGTKFGFMLSDNAGTPLTDANEVNGILFDYSKTQKFLILMRPYDRAGANKVTFDIYLNDILVTTKPSAAYTIAQIQDVSFLRAQDRIVILHESVQPKQLVGSSNGTVWTLSDISFANKPVFDFSLIDGTTYRAAGNTFTPSAASGIGITLTGSGAFFNAGHVGGLFIGGGGIFRITAVNAGGTIATGYTIEAFSGTTPINGTDALLLEVAWGDSSAGLPAGHNRGWPSVGTLFQNRLVLANSLILPNLVWASSLGDYSNFNDEAATDLDSFSVALGTNGNEEVQSLIGNTSLFAFGFSGVYSTSLFTDLPLTPSNVFFNRQENTGCAAIEAQVIDSKIFFVDENLDQINAAEYAIADSTVNIANISILSPQLIEDPVSATIYRPATDDGALYMVVNSDGTLATFLSVEDQFVRSWTLADTRGSFKQAIALRDIAYFVQRRTLNLGATTTGLCDNVFKTNGNFDAFTDITTAAGSGGTNVTLFTNQNDYVVFGHESPYYRIAVTLATPASATIVPTFEYLNNLGTWTTFTPTSDGSTGFSASGSIVWVLNTNTPDWKPIDIEDACNVHLPANSINGIKTKFWMRIRRTVSSLATKPIETTLLINTANRIYLESANYSQYTDSTITTTSNGAGLVVGLTHLVGQQVYVRADSVPEGPYFVNSSGQITIKTLSSSNVQVGLNYIPLIIPMPVVAQSSYENTLFSPKHVKDIYIYYFESLGIIIEGFEIPTLLVGQLVLDQMPIPVTDFYKKTLMGGWDPRKTYSITQDLPLPMTIIGVGYTLEV